MITSMQPTDCPCGSFLRRCLAFSFKGCAGPIPPDSHPVLSTIVALFILLPLQWTFLGFFSSLPLPLPTFLFFKGPVSLYSSGWLGTHRSTCLLSAGIKGVCHNPWPMW